jgi:hypothetical protein
MSKITKHNLQMQIDTLKGFRVSMQAEINRMKEWISDIEKTQAHPNVNLPKSTRYDVEVGSRLDSLEARMDMVEGMLKTSICDAMTKEIPEPQTERNIVYDWLIMHDGINKEPSYCATIFDEVKEIYKIAENTYLFAAYKKIWEYPRIYIGHYE